MESIYMKGEDPVDTEQSICRGYGACSKSGCHCREYEGSGTTCANPGCGHAYEDHW